MKYIRTKDGVCECVPAPFPIVYQRQAGAIEELCDYVFLFDDEPTIRKITHEDDEGIMEWLRECVGSGMRVKFAILTDEGLIYVAEMNGEGGIELL